MKRFIKISAVVSLSAFQALAQNVQVRLDDALASYRSEDLENARFSLQEALNEINQAVGKEILNALPSEMKGMSKVDEADNVTGVNLGFAGLFVSRSYRDDNREASIDLISDSPMMAGLNTILAMPAFVSSDDNQKRIKVSGYKALLSWDTKEDGKMSYDLQIPLNNSLLTFQCSGMDNENEVLDMADMIPVKQIVDISN